MIYYYYYDLLLVLLIILMNFVIYTVHAKMIFFAIAIQGRKEKEMETL